MWCGVGMLLNYENVYVRIVYLGGVMGLQYIHYKDDNTVLYSVTKFTYTNYMKNKLK